MSYTSEGGKDFHDKISKLFQSMTGEPGKRWARPEEPILHNLNDEKEEPYIFFHNSNYRVSRKYINIEKVKVRMPKCRESRARRVCLHMP